MMTVLALANFGNFTQIGPIISVSHRPKASIFAVNVMCIIAANIANVNKH